MMKSFYDFEAEDAMCEMRKMEEYRGKVVLVVNTATQCGFTSQYDDLQDLYEKYQDAGFQIHDFPCNQFGIIVGEAIMRYNYLTENTCSQMISFDLNGNVVTNISYMGGCNGNLQTIERILDGWTVEEIEQKIGDIKCGRRPTSCSGQLAIAVRKAYDGLLKPEE